MDAEIPRAFTTGQGEVTVGAGVERGSQGNRGRQGGHRKSKE